MSLFIPSVITKRISFKLIDINANDDASLRHYFETIITNKYEGLCITEGFIKKHSIKLITFSSGQIIKNCILFDITFNCDIFCPVKGSIIECRVATITKAGIRAFSSKETISPFVVYVTKDYSFTMEDETFEIGDLFTAKVVGYRYELDDKKVEIIGEFIDMVDKKRMPYTNTKVRMAKKKKTQKEKKEEQKKEEQKKLEAVKEKQVEEKKSEEEINSEGAKKKEEMDLEESVEKTESAEKTK